MARAGDNGALLAHGLEDDDGGALGHVERADAGALRQRDDARGKAPSDVVVDAAFFGADDDDGAFDEVGVPRGLVAAHLDDPRIAAQQRQAARQRVVKVHARPRPVVEPGPPHRAIAGIELRAADVQGGADGGAEADAGADVAGDGGAVEDEVDDGFHVGFHACYFFVMSFNAHRALFAAGLVVAILGGGCSCGKDADDAPAKKAFLDELVRRRVPDTELVVALPKGWLIETPNPGPMPPPVPGATKIELKTRTLLSARPGTPAPGTLVAPQLLVLEDPWLPTGTTGVDYLVAQRASNQAALGLDIRHVDAEPSRREGRPTYHIRDEWTVRGATFNKTLSQEALLILDDVKAPDGSAALHGYTVVITLEKTEFEKLQPLVREILASVKFEEKSPPPTPAK